MSNPVAWRGKGQNGCLALTMVVLVLASAITLAGCVSQGGRPSDAAVRTSNSILPQPVATGTPASQSDLLAVQDADGNIFTVRPDGTDRSVLTFDAAKEHFYRHLAWSPDGASLAWWEYLMTSRGLESSALYVHNVDGGTTNRIDTGQHPAIDYTRWSPDSRQIAFLINSGDGGRAMQRIAVVDDAPTALTMAQQAPFFAWSPDSDRIFAHFRPDRLGMIGLDGGETPISATPGDFTTPAWLPDNTLLYVTRKPDGQSLVLGTPEGREIKDLALVNKPVDLAPNPTGSHVAFTISGLSIPFTAYGPLFVVNIRDGQTITITSEIVIAFFWSPDGQQLAYLTVDSWDRSQVDAPLRVSAHAQRKGAWLRWNVWDGSATKQLVSFIPSDKFRFESLLFFTQTGMTPWSPDSRALVYASSDGNGPDGIWVQPVTGNEPPRRVADGVYAAWSPR